MRASAIWAGVALAAVAVTPDAMMRAAPRAAKGHPAPYAPGLGEIMSLQQMRHAKLWFAGSAGNWELAAYELDELKEGFDDVLSYAPVHDGVPLTPMVRTITGQNIPAIAKAIAVHDGGTFAAAFDALTAGCNACHQAARHGFIVIQRPTGLPYTNQNFAPTR
jgi:hypothetical protein